MNILITAGGTTEKIDDVRKITNSGTGRLGATVADCFADFDAVNKIYYICSEKAVRPINTKTEEIVADDTLALEKAVRTLCESTDIDVVVHSMAVSDYRVKNVSTAEIIAEGICNKLSGQTIAHNPENKDDNDGNNIEDIIATAISNPPSLIEKSSSASGKISSSNENLVIVMEKTPKIISLFRNYLPNSTIFGFKLLVDVPTETLIDVGYDLLNKNDCDYVVANDLRTTGTDNHIAHIIDRKKQYNTYNGKKQIAEAICDIAIRKDI